MARLRKNFWIFLLLVCISPLAKASSASGNSWMQWTACSRWQDCDWQRNDTCSTGRSPQSACGDKVWREERKGCDKCGKDIWMLRTPFRECKGSGCANSYRTEEYICANQVRQAGCEKTLFKFCDPAKTCDGSWSAWRVAKCSHSCGGGIQFQVQSCLLDGAPSGNCDKTIKSLTNSKWVQCNTQSCDVPKDPVWGPWSKCQCEEANNQKRSCTQNCNLLPSKYQYRNCSRCPTTTTTRKTTTSKTATTISTTTLRPLVVPLSPKSVDQRNWITKLETTTSGQSGAKEEQNTGPWLDKVIIIATAAIIIILLILIIAILAVRSRRKTKPVQIQVHPHAPHDATTYNSLLRECNKPIEADNNSQSIYEEMRTGMTRSESSPNVGRPLPITPSVRSQPPKPPRRHRPLSEISVHSFPDFTAVDGLLRQPQGTNESANSAPSSPSGTLQGHYSVPTRNHYLSPLN